MAYFEGVGGSGGSIVVTCDSEFAGSTISCSDGTNTMTAVCPSVSPYEVEFMVSDSGTYEISATVSGTTYTTEVVIDLELEAALEYGFSWPRWVTYGGLDPSDYEDLEEVFSDEAAVRRLMTIHASADYLIDCVTDKLNDIDAFCANDTAMKWIGLRDYVCDGLTAITGVEAKFLASQYWERYLKDHVPTMTSNTAPYGTAGGANKNQATDYYIAFNGNTTSTQTSDGYISCAENKVADFYVYYKFTNPICVKKLMLMNPLNVQLQLLTFKVQASNDGSTWTDLGGTYTKTNTTGGAIEYFEIENDDYYLYYRVNPLTSTGASTFVSIQEIQFYGRSLDVSVPVMTSNTAPYGEVFYSSQYTGSSSYAWKAFTQTIGDSDSWKAGDNDLTGHIGYEFVTPIQPKICLLYVGAGDGIRTCKIQASNNKTDANSWVDISEVITPNHSNWNEVILESNGISYSALRLLVVTQGTTNRAKVEELQFYGVDYSEKEFETGTTKKWLYDHGVELETLDYTTCKASDASISNNGEQLLLNTGSGTYSCAMLLSNSAIDLTNFNFEFIKLGDKYIGPSSSGAFTVNVFSQKPYDYNSIGSYRQTSIVPNAPLTNLRYGVDVSAYNESKIIGVGQRSNSIFMSFSEWWLE